MPTKTVSAAVVIRSVRSFALGAKVRLEVDGAGASEAGVGAEGRVVLMAGSVWLPTPEPHRPCG